jgi:hypothetical protein
LHKSSPKKEDIVVFDYEESASEKSTKRNEEIMKEFRTIED